MSDNPNAHPLTDGSKFVVVKALVGENVYLLQGDDAQITLSHAEAAQDGLVEAAQNVLKWLQDPQMGTWTYVEGNYFYRDIDAHAKSLTAALSAIGE